MEAEGVSHKKEKEGRRKHFAIFGKWEEEEVAQPHRTGQQTGCAKKQRRSSDNASSAADYSSEDQLIQNFL